VKGLHRDSTQQATSAGVAFDKAFSHLCVAKLELTTFPNFFFYSKWTQQCGLVLKKG
jgi:hypothetical protein